VPADADNGASEEPSAAVSIVIVQIVSNITLASEFVSTWIVVGERGGGSVPFQTRSPNVVRLIAGYVPDVVRTDSVVFHRVPSCALVRDRIVADVPSRTIARTSTTRGRAFAARRAIDLRPIRDRSTVPATIHDPARAHAIGRRPSR